MVNIFSEMERSVNNQLIKEILHGSDEKMSVMLAMDGGGIRGICLLQVILLFLFIVY